MDIINIERRRRQMNIPVDRLCAVADLDRRHYYRLVSREAAPRADTISRLNMALGRHNKGVGAEAHQMAPHAVLKATMVLAALSLGVDPRMALDTDPSRRATSSPEWMEATRVRRVAIYIANQFLGFSQSDMARASGMTKQAISPLIKELEDERATDPALKAVLDEMEEVFA